MRKERRGDKAHRKEKEDHGQDGPARRRSDAEEMYEGIVEKVMGEKEDREGDEDKNRNDDQTSRHRVSLRASAILSFYPARAGMKKIGSSGEWEVGLPAQAG